MRRDQDAGQTASVKRAGLGQPDLDAGRFCLALRGRRLALFGQHICVRPRPPARPRRLPSRRAMRPVNAASARRAGWLFASASAAALACSSNASFAACTLNVPGGQVLAVSGDTCNVSGSYSTTANSVIAGQATGVNALITGPNAGTVTFSTTGASANGRRRTTGGVISLTPTPAAPGTVTTTGVGSIGLLATGSGEEEGRLVASQITIQNVNVSTSGAAVLNGPTANGIESDDGAIANITDGSVTTAAAANGAVGVSATGGGQPQSLERRSTRMRTGRRVCSSLGPDPR